MALDLEDVDSGLSRALCSLILGCSGRGLDGVTGSSKEICDSDVLRAFRGLLSGRNKRGLDGILVLAEEADIAPADRGLDGIVVFAEEVDIDLAERALLSLMSGCDKRGLDTGLEFEKEDSVSLPRAFNALLSDCGERNDDGGDDTRGGRRLLRSVITVFI